MADDELAHDEIVDDEMADDDREPFPLIQVGMFRWIPDLARIPKERWREALARFSPLARDEAVRKLRDPREHFDALLIAGECNTADEEARARMSRATEDVRVRVPVPEARPSPRRIRQVNVRLYARDFESLARAARVLGTTPTELARILIVRGTRRVLEEATPRAQP